MFFMHIDIGLELVPYQVVNYQRYLLAFSYQNLCSRGMLAFPMVFTRSCFILENALFSVSQINVYNSLFF